MEESATRGPAEVIAEYFRCVVEKDADGIFELFAPDGVWIDWRGTVLHGNAAIRDWYAQNPFRRPVGVKPSPLVPIIEGNRGVVEINAETSEGHNRVVDIFTVNDDGRVSSLRIYQSTYVPGA